MKDKEDSKTSKIEKLEGKIDLLIRMNRDIIEVLDRVYFCSTRSQKFKKWDKEVNEYLNNINES